MNMLFPLALSLQTHPSIYQRKGDAALASGKYQVASDLYRKGSEGYAKQGDLNASKILREKSLRYGTTIRWFKRKRIFRTGPLAIHEPTFGCYLGVNIEREEATKTPQAFNDLVGKHHATFFRYRAYGMPFPKREALELKRAKSGMQIAFEPLSLDKVRDDAYLRAFANDCRDSGIPIFLRFASEFNGAWTPYHRDPEAYKTAFRTVARVMHSIAPNVAMVWCPNEIPEAPIERYYPGKEAVDWVGVNFYSVIYNDADRSRGAEWRWPTDQLDYVYRKYATRHPIMVGEWAATHMSSVDRAARPDFAMRKIRQFYATLPLLYPNVKAVHWLSFNALKFARGERQLNNYSLFDDGSVANAYYGEIASDWYLENVPAERAPESWREVPAGSTLAPGDQVAVFFRSYGPTRLTVKADGKTVYSAWSEPVAQFEALKAAKWEAVLIDAKGKVAGRSRR
ncbi:hypothetical protein EON81_16855 [bacterium]|nr:MAG: hypothetical protein EON81_16855 [bacterium]